MKKMWIKRAKKEKPVKTKLKKSRSLAGFFKNIKIAPRILIGFLIIAALGTGMGLYDSVVLSQVSSASSFMYKEMLLPLRNMSSVSEDFEQQGILIRNMLVSDNDMMTVAYVSQIKNNTNTIESTLHTVGMLVTEVNAKAKLDKLNNAFSDFNAKLTAAVNMIQSGNKAAVSKDILNAGELYMATQNVSTALDDLNSELTSKSAAQDTANKSEAEIVQTVTWFLIAAVLFLSLFIGITTARSISKPVKKLTRTVELLAEGDTDIKDEIIGSKNEIGKMGVACNSILASIKKLEEDTDMLIEAAAEGRLSVRADSGEHKGAYRKIIEGFNRTLDAVTQPVNEAAGILDQVSKGNLEYYVEGNFQGDHAIIKNSVNQTIDKLQELVADTDGLTQAAVEGRLSYRADFEKYEGAYRRIIEGFNATLDEVLRPIGEAVSVLQEVAKGNLEVSVTGEFQGDHAIIKNALNETITTLKNYIREISSVLGEIAKANFNTGIQAEYLGDFVELKNSINKILNSLNQLMLEVSMASDQMATATRQLSEASQSISIGATEQASSVEELTTSLNYITEQTQQNANYSHQSNQMSLAAKQAAAQCSGQMQEMLKSMSEINESSENIFKIIKVIDDIAFQTNILALNAAVEAARAGVHGKGFAVVAEEVRSLAARSASAAQETADLIEGSIKKVAAGTKIANTTADALANIVKNVDQSALLGDKIAHASSEQASGIAQINQGLAQVANVVQTNSATAQQGAAASQELYGQAEMLKKKMDVFSLRGLEGTSGPVTSAEHTEPEFFTDDSEKY